MKETILSGGVACRIEGSGPRLVLFHGGGGSWTHWIRNIPELGKHFTVFALDLPGFGDSSDVPPDIDPHEYVGIVGGAVDEIARGGQIDLAAFSFGGVNAAMLAVRMPQTIRKLALLAPGGLGRVSNAGSQYRKMPPGDAPEADKREVLRHNLALMMLARPESIDEATVDIQRDNVARTRFNSRRFTGSTLTREALPNLRTPTIGIFGALDNLSHPSVYARVDPCRSLKPDMRIELVPDTGHWVQYEAAEAVNRLLIEFFR
ncbi:MAG: alpha/beta fold hydrolase [Burkholderiales bacterium]|nr:alpha/beta fold hydrolase [Burkholderiales bacterium]